MRGKRIYNVRKNPLPLSLSPVERAHARYLSFHLRKGDSSPMANRMVLNHADLARMPPHIQAQISSQMVSQGSSIPVPRQPRSQSNSHSRAAINRIPLSRTFYIGWSVLMGVLLTSALLLYTLNPY